MMTDEERRTTGEKPGKGRPRRLIILGSTGSIGRQTLEVVAARPDQFRVVGLAARGSWQLVVEQALRFGPEVVALEDPEAARQTAAALATAGRRDIAILRGGTAATQVAAWPGADTVVAAMLGRAGLEPALAALGLRRRVALANKESLVVGGHLVLAKCRETGAQLLPVDSEHSAAFQLLAGVPREQVRTLVLTASGGPFRGWTAQRMREVTPEMATAHPTWHMGAKISVDSATLMNKGLEVIEASWLFGMPLDRIEVVVHPESLVHAAVTLTDGALVTHMAPTDMRIPIALALTWPERQSWPWGNLSLGGNTGHLTFVQPDMEAFPCLGLAYEAARVGGTMPAVLSAADEVAVDAFLARRISFAGIAEVIRRSMEGHAPKAGPSLEEVDAADRWARARAAEVVEVLGR